MKVVIGVGAAIVLIAVSFRVFGQSNTSVSVASPKQKRPLSASVQHPKVGSHYLTPSMSETAMPPDPQFSAAERALYAEAYQHEKEAHDLFVSGDLPGAEQAANASLAAAPIINGRQAKMPLVRQLLGKIYLAEGRNQDALNAFQSCYHNIADAGQNLDIAIAYARLGNYEQAKHFYSNRAITQYRLSQEPLLPEGLPGTADLKHLEASALLARGIDAFFSGQKQEAFNDLEAAGRLAPANGLIPYYQGMALLHMNRRSEILPYFARAATFGHGEVATEAQQRLSGWPAPARAEAMRQAAARAQQ